uniref:Low-temperature-induced 65 kDa protein-like n=1 Tax=Nelumbo nucifera TaxID=4432 RepID=A0A822Y727_NELNU|nr:TPA_asm: hypothetical protein HUJ06_029725 [Nelumbo nucifera]
MAQMERIRRPIETPITPTVEQLLHDDESKWGASSPTLSSISKHYDQDEDHIHHSKKSVLAKVREKAKKWRQTLANKKKNNQDENATPSWGVSLDEDEEEDEDPEYFGAPMYESEMAPEACKENARQHPRANPVISDKHILVTSAVHRSDQDNQKTESKPVAYSKAITADSKPIAADRKIIAADSKPVSADSKPVAADSKLVAADSKPVAADSKPVAAYSEPVAAYSNPVAADRKPVAANSEPVAAYTNPVAADSKTITETVTEKLAPAYAKVTETVSETLAPAYAAVTQATNIIASKIHGSPTSASETGPQSIAISSSEQKWDKGVSVKEFLMQKLEPGEEERALSQMISEAMSPRKVPGEMGVVEKVREAVSSLLNVEESPSLSSVPSTTDLSTATGIPVSTNAHEVVEIENEGTQGRIVQTN